MSKKINAGSAMAIDVGGEKKKLWGVMFINIPIEDSVNLNRYYLSAYNNKGVIYLLYRLGLLNSIGLNISASLLRNMPAESNAILVVDRGLRFLIIPGLGCYAGAALFSKNNTVKTDILLVSMFVKSQILTQPNNKSMFFVFSMNSDNATIINLDTGKRIKVDHNAEYYRFHYRRDEYQRKVFVSLKDEQIVTTLGKVFGGQK